MSFRLKLLIILLAGIFRCATIDAFAQADGEMPLDITADHMEYLSDQGLVVARGNVRIRDGDSLLKADYMTVNSDTMDVTARGNVVYTNTIQSWKGDEFTYNVRTRQGDFGNFTGFYDPFYITAKESKRVSTNEIHFKDVVITTCEGDDPAVSMKAREASIKDRRVTARGVKLYAANLVPFMYLPYYSRSLDFHERYFQNVIGYDSRLGMFLLTGYNYPLFGTVRGITHFDLFSKRGVGLGQSFVWRDDEKTYDGMAQAWYISDSEPLEGDASEGRTEENVDEERYRLRLAHTQKLSPRDTFIGELNYLSDPYILEDFFNSEYRYNVQPENRATLTHRGDNYTAAIQFNGRLNDFYENVNRLPELSLNVPRQEILDSNFYYESDSTASQLERVFPEDSEDEDYSSFRIDSRHMIYYPTRHFGFLNLIPRAGYRFTYYSETVSTDTKTNSVIVTDENGVPVTNDMGLVSFTNVTSTTVNDDGTGVRNVVELGWEGSFKAFKTWDDFVFLSDGDGIRHVIEPYLDHTYIPEPNLTPDELPQFDDVDTVDEQHNVKLGMRNKLQTRREKVAVDVIDLDVYTFYNIEKPDGEEDFSDVFFDGDLRLVQWMPIEFDGSYDTYESEFSTFNTEIGVQMQDKSKLYLEYRYRRDNQSLVGTALDLFPEDRWSFELGARYDLEEDELEEHYYMVKNRRECLSWGAGIRQVDDDLQVWLQVWLSAFPDVLMNMGY